MESPYSSLYETITVHISKIDSLIKTSDVYNDLIIESENSLITLPKNYYFENIEQLLTNDIQKILHILRYWNINSLPREVIVYALYNIEETKNLEKDLIKYFDEINVIVKDNDNICNGAATIGSLNLLKVAHENGCTLIKEAYILNGYMRYDATCTFAARNGHINCLEYLQDNDCVFDEDTFEAAASGGHLDCIIYLCKNNCPWNESVCTAAAINGHLKCLMWLHKHGCPWDDFYICTVAATSGHLDCLIYAHENGGLFDEYIYLDTRKMGHNECLKYIEKFITKS
jgi:hypothetical protein